MVQEKFVYLHTMYINGTNKEFKYYSPYESEILQEEDIQLPTERKLDPKKIRVIYCLHSADDIERKIREKYPNEDFEESDGTFEFHEDSLDFILDNKYKINIKYNDPILYSSRLCLYNP